MTQDKPDSPAERDVSTDRSERINDFLARHGGASARPSHSETVHSGVQGRIEVYAADGYALRCDWSRFGSREEMSFTEVSPAQAAPGSGQNSRDEA